MKKKLRTKVINLIAGNKEISNDDIEILEYGFDCLYIVISKLILIGFVCYLLGMLKEFLVFFVIYGIIRTFSFGVHAPKAWICNIISITVYAIVPFLCKYIIINNVIKLFLGIIFSIVFIMYSPADTENRPIISKKRRLVFKVVSMVIVIIFTIVSIICTNSFISNALLLAVVVQGIMILPLTYFIFGQPYNNYKRMEGELI